MPNYFFTRELETVSPSQRYPGWARGWQIWREFESGLPDTLPRILAELVRARASVNIATFPAGPRVFVSHKQEDAARALQIAKAECPAIQIVGLSTSPRLQEPARSSSPERRAASPRGVEMQRLIEYLLVVRAGMAIGSAD